MKALVRVAAVVLWVCLCSPSRGLAMSFRYDVEIQNRLTVATKIEVAQYHSEGFDGRRPKEFTERLKLDAKVFQVAAGETLKVHYSDAAGGFWLLWKRMEPAGLPPASGVLDLTTAARTIVIQ